MTYINIIPRSEWGNRYGVGWNKRPVPAKHVIIHHSETNAPPANATLAQDVEAVRYLDYIGWLRFNQYDTGYTRPKGAGISYTWAVTPSGRVFQGHDITLTSSHTGGYNISGVGIVLIGNYTNVAPTAKQIDAVARLLLQAKQDGHIATTKVDFGHRDVGNTTCPGNLGYTAVANVNKRVAELTAPPPDPNKGYTVDWIKNIQTGLQTLSYYTGLVNGHLPDVDPAVRKFQADNNLEVDGLPGPKTNAVLTQRLDEYNAFVLREREIAAAVHRTRISASDQWATAEVTALTVLPSGKGVLLAAIESADERYAIARAGGDVRYLPLRPVNDVPPSNTVRALKIYKPEWIRVVGGDTVITDNCIRKLLEELSMI